MIRRFSIPFRLSGKFPGEAEHSERSNSIDQTASLVRPDITEAGSDRKITACGNCRLEPIRSRISTLFFRVIPTFHFSFWKVSTGLLSIIPFHPFRGGGMEYGKSWSPGPESADLAGGNGSLLPMSLEQVPRKAARSACVDSLSLGLSDSLGLSIGVESGLTGGGA
jgi:hypothetical protein